MSAPGIGAMKTVRALERRVRYLESRRERGEGAPSAQAFELEELRATVAAIAAVKLYRSEALEGEPSTIELLLAAAAAVGATDARLHARLLLRAERLEAMADAES